MTAIHFDSNHDDDRRREGLYAGDLYVFSACDETRAFAGHAREMIVEAFGAKDPQRAQYDMAVEDYAALLGKLKPSFIHHPESARLLTRVLDRFGVDLGQTYFEVPKMRSSTSDGYLTAGIAYAWHPHRDTWYSAPQCQINWWMPVYEITETNTMTFYPKYWDAPLENTSSGYNYYRWNMEHRGTHITKHVNEDPRPLPRGVGDHDLGPEVRVVCPPGGLVLFAGAQMHASVENTSGVTRFSVDFRTAHGADLAHEQGAPNLDSACTGTCLREFRRASDLAAMPDELVAIYEDGTEGSGDAVYRGEDPRRS
jgi:hypothetical protein